MYLTFFVAASGGNLELLRETIFESVKKIRRPPSHVKIQTVVLHYGQFRGMSSKILCVYFSFQISQFWGKVEINKNTNCFLKTMTTK